MCRTCPVDLNPQCQGHSWMLLAQSVHFYNEGIEHVFACLTVGDIDPTIFPTQHVQRAEIHGSSTSIVHSDQKTTFSSGLANMPSLQIARKGDQRFLAQNLSLMNVSQSPIVVALLTQIIERTRGIGFVPRAGS